MNSKLAISYFWFWAYATNKFDTTRCSASISMKFEISTPLGFTVRTSEEYWQRLIIKHPDIEELEQLIQSALAAPDEIRRSSRDAEVLLFYRARKEKRWVVAVARRLNGDGFLITAYQTDAIKEGETVWLK
ncbi:hypothetical protein [Nostoc sp. UHCC 0870]|uniref:hypothetical protein n=1 Tax=Nostoc sp. UHCC 0870 TaxID=2914041 RepID=UPI001EDE6C29|nr:hypothetical protein [Nostoc sp. UHCC 0870]UKO97023.1 hypothetical protein L6494_20870 [Nostoc sp. UHCC 0870]